MYSLEEFIIAVYCVVDDFLVPFSEQHNLRKGGFAPAFSDSETLTLLLVGEFLGLDTDKAIHAFFRRGRWREWFPRLDHRTTLARQSANLWRVMQILQRVLSQRLGAFEENVHLIDGFPMVVSCITRAARCRGFRGEATRGFCASKKLKYYGFHGHLVVSCAGIITACTTSTNARHRGKCCRICKALSSETKATSARGFSKISNKKRD